MAYADKELDSEERNAVRDLIAQDAAARHLIGLFRWTTYIVQKAFADVDFEKAPRKLTDTIWSPARPSRFKPLGMMFMAAAACMLLALAVARMADVGATGGAHDRIALGHVPADSLLANALAHAEPGKPVVLGKHHFLGVASLEDRFGRTCVQLDVFSDAAASVPASVVVACRRSGSDWAVVGALATSNDHAPSRPAYVPSAAEAHNALDGILEMIGANQKTTALEPENRPR